jgi:SAM-dependent methyltransferase
MRKPISLVSDPPFITMSLPFETSSKVYDLLYHDKDYPSEAAFIHNCLRRKGNVPRSILELGSGTGLHSKLLAWLGHDMAGVDLSPGMIAKAEDLKASQPENIRTKMSFHEGNVRTFKLGRKVDAVVSLFHVVSYQTTNSEVLEMFRNAREHLEAGGVFLFDGWYGPAVLSCLPAVRVKRGGDSNLEVIRLCEPVLDTNQCWVDVNYTYLVKQLPGGEVSESRETHRMRYFFLPELEHFLSCAGFRLARSFEWLSGKPLSSGTFGACFIGEAV